MVKSVERNYAVDLTSAVSRAIDRESARMLEVSRASNLAANLRRPVAIRMRTFVTHPMHAKKTSHAHIRSSSRVTAKHRSRR